MTENTFGRKCGTILTAVAAALFTVAAAIALPILLRSFYYRQIRTLNIPQTSGYSEEVIRGAYDEVMDFLVYGEEFGTGELAYSEEGKSHFEDCRKLFLLDFQVMGVSGVLLLASAGMAVYRKKKQQQFAFRHLAVFWSAVSLCGIFAALALWGAVSFDTLFVAFHAAFFPGKSNWIFDPARDQIISILPQDFFMNCAVLIAVCIFAAVIVFFASDAVWRRRHRRAF